MQILPGKKTKHEATEFLMHKIHRGARGKQLLHDY
jgi:hypothetical protein